MTADPDDPPRQREPPWGWIGACGVLAVIAICLLIWGLGLQSDLDDQRAATHRAQQQARTAQERAGDISTRLDQARRTLEDFKRALEAASGGLQGSLGGVLDDLQRRLDALKERVSGALP
jgi:type VI protein secretion system component VasK